MAADAEQDAGESSLIDHLIELRSRLLRGAAGLLLALLCLLPFANTLYGLLAQPLLDKLPKGGQLIATQVASPFFAPMKLAFFAALMIAMPWLLYQAWAFVAPGLYKREKKLALPLLVSAVLLFYAGCAFAFFVVLPAVFGFLTHITPDAPTIPKIVISVTAQNSNVAVRSINTLVLASPSVVLLCPKTGMKA